MTYKVEIDATKQPNDVHIYYELGETFYINLKNNLEKYKDNLKYFYSTAGKEDFIISDKFNKSYNELQNGDILVFEFDNEEEAFYFSLKYS